MRQTRDPTPKACMRILPIVWFLWASLCLGCLGLGGVFLAGIISVPQTQSFMGTLTPNRTPTELRLPAGLPLKSILVEAGETVRAGQTVAILDQAAMRARLHHIERSIAVATHLRECLLVSPGQNDESAGEDERRTPDYPDLQSNDAELAVLLRAADAECKTNRQADANKQVRLERGLYLLQERLILVNQKLAMLLGAKGTQPTKGVNPVVRAHASVSVALERNEMAQKIQALTDELDRMRVTQDQARLARVARLSEDVAQKLAQQAVLVAYLEHPRLTVPESGRISRVRPVPAGSEFDRDEVLMEVHSLEAAQYVADLRVPVAQVSALPLGTDVIVSLAGFTESGPRLHGRIERWVEGDSETGTHYAQARIALAQDSQDMLADPRNGIALRGATTASAIRAVLEDRTLKEAVLDAVSDKSAWLQNAVHRFEQRF